ncbi:helix-turn-helix domain-containing protein [Roseivirga seohaensis]|uniref:helix-turn-helix domain-containing protein n=1 Tax=Roseivirga seohaensis TaxID=1914963 RepID=UPI003BAA6D9F
MAGLSKTLKDARESMNMTLRDVEKVTNISNAYLSQLENDKIKKPSASVLYKLASAYKIDIKLFLNASGIVQDNESVKSAWSERIAFLTEEMEPSQKEQVVDYINFIKKRN